MGAEKNVRHWMVGRKEVSGCDTEEGTEKHIVPYGGKSETRSQRVWRSGKKGQTRRRRTGHVKEASHRILAEEQSLVSLKVGVRKAQEHASRKASGTMLPPTALRLEFQAGGVHVWREVSCTTRS